MALAQSHAHGGAVAEERPRRARLSDENALSKEILARHAAQDLLEKDPNSSAFHSPGRAAPYIFAALIGLAGVGLALAPLAFLIGANIVMGLISLLANMIRHGFVIMGCIHKESRRVITPKRIIPDAELPIYTALVPLYREAAVVPQLIRVLKEIDYPRDKLDIKILLEEDDTETRDALRREAMDSRFQILIVPDCPPRTKGKACNYGLFFAEGAYVTIYDAEDIPHPRQLRDAAACFQDAPANVAALQAYLEFFNPNHNWLARQFTLEYLMHFRFFLPVSSHFDMPVFLGGTSNHLRVGILRELHGWDAYNVTEDAELGLRLRREGYRAAIFASHTREEPNTKAGNWIRQRSRWIKGWLQTYQADRRARREGGDSREKRRWLEILYINLIVPCHVIHIVSSFILWPLALILFVDYMMSEGSGAGAIVLFNICLTLTGYALAVAAGVSASAAHGRVRWLESLTIPAYWYLAAPAIGKALWQFFSKPHYWEKTRHGLTKEPRPSAPAPAPLPFPALPAKEERLSAARKESQWA